MKYRYGLILMISLFIGERAFAQNAEGCDGQRYLGDIFTMVKKTTVLYASNTDNIGFLVNLSLDVYEPENDSQEKRPVVVLAHGGSFIGGNKADMKDFCESFARKGYVAVSVQYRLWNFAGGFPDANGFIGTCARAIGDFKGAVRWLRYDADNGNQFRIDPEYLFVGGVSAGSITALHATYMDSTDAITPQINAIISQQGGWQGNTGIAESFAYPTSTIGVIDIVGALFDSTYINAGDPPLMSIHGTADETVPYGAGAFLGQIQLHGSSCLYHRAQDVGVPAYFVSVPGGSHSLSEASSLPYVLEFQAGIVAEMEEILCTTTARKELQSSAPEVSLYPNPASDICTLGIRSERPDQGTLIIYDALGHAVLETPVQSTDDKKIRVAEFRPGVYYLQFNWNHSAAFTRRLVIE